MYTFLNIKVKERKREFACKCIMPNRYQFYLFFKSAYQIHINKLSIVRHTLHFRDAPTIYTHILDPNITTTLNHFWFEKLFSF